MSDDTRPIGVFDSGVGGLSVLAEIRRRFPEEDLVYVADQRWAPYGDRSLADVSGRAFEITGRLITEGAKAVVVACNSASAAALHALRRVHPAVPFVGMEPAVKPAALRSRSGVVGVIATRATFQGELFASVVDRHSNGARVLTGAPAGLVELVEDGRCDADTAGPILRPVLEPMVAEGMDTLVLGCTHYAFVKEAIRSVAGDAVAIVDPGPAVARRVGRVLEMLDLSAPQGARGEVRFHTTLDPGRFAAAIRDLVGVTPRTPTRW